MTTKLIHTKDLILRKKNNNINKIRYTSSILKTDKFLPLGIIRKKITLRSRVKNRCLNSGRCRATLNKFAFSRMTFKVFANNNNINGVMKTSW